MILRSSFLSLIPIMRIMIRAKPCIRQVHYRKERFRTTPIMSVWVKCRRIWMQRGIKRCLLSESSRMTIIKGMARRTGMTGAANTGAQSGTRVMLRELSERIVWKSFLTPHGQRRQVSGSDYSSIWIICSRSDIPE